MSEKTASAEALTTELQAELDRARSMLENGVDEVTPNGDEALILYTDGVQKSLTFVKDFLNKFFTKLG